MNRVSPISPDSRARLLLKRLRSVMAEGSYKNDERLELVTTLIANSMVTDVCSIYVRIGRSEILLVAATGLEPSVLGKMRLKDNEGLIGMIVTTARPCRLRNAQIHPRFVRRPESGEAQYHGFLGVPLIRGGRVLGVLAVQDRSERYFSDEEVEVLQIIAMLLAEMVGSEAIRLESRDGSRIVLEGCVLNEGLAIGPAHLHDPIVSATRLLSADPQAEALRLKRALSDLRDSIDVMLRRGKTILFGESRDVLEAYRLFAHDLSWERRLAEAVRSGLTAEAAVDRVRREHRALLGSVRGAFLRERLHDLEDLENRLLRHLTGDSEKVLPKPGSILVAGRIGPADLLEYHNTQLAGLALEEASSESHAAIISRTLDIPALGELNRLTGQVEQGDLLILDTDTGKLHVCPPEPLIVKYRQRLEFSSRVRKANAELRLSPAVTRDGVRVRLMMNAGLKLDLERMEETGAEGVGLFRTEFQFMASDRLPSLAEQSRYYRSVMDVMGDKPITFRTLDLGGDKIASFMDRRMEQNPAMGWRALRIGLDHPLFFRRQIRALIRAAKQRPLRLMFPLVATVAEFSKARALVEAEMEWAQKFGRPVPQELQVGVMVEVPSLALSIPQLAGLADFLAIGSNDLCQFLFAADRNNERVFSNYGLFSPPMLRLMQQIGEQARAANIPVSVCGEVAGEALEAVALAALGYRDLSMRAGRIAATKRVLQMVQIKQIAKVMQQIIDSGSSDGQNVLLKFLRQNDALS